ncbi:MAG: hypothetical protein HY470_01575, partial [Candidatus Ryanbacteria bacterium]|nr:hypothetical protein [Candidatus Ryanbacteria bacterium]
MLKCLFASFGLLVLSANAGAAAVITKPDAKGDEVIFYYDARQDMRSIIAIPNEGVVPLRVRIRFHGENFNQYFERFVAVEGGASAVLISDNLVAEGLAPTVGIGFAVAVNGANQPITTRALSGVYLAANARSKMGTGRTILARSATTFFGTPVPVGSMIDGTNVALAQIQPKRLSLPSFFNPEHIEPEELAFFCFNDTPAGEVVAALTTWEVNATRDDGSSYGRATVNVNGT